MNSSSKKTLTKTGMAPGTLLYVGDADTSTPVKVSVLQYDENEIQEADIIDVKDCLPFVDTPQTTWINFDGITDVNKVEEIGKCFDIHPLALEDILNTKQRPKIEDYENLTFITLKIIRYDKKQLDISFDNFSIVLGKNYVVTFLDRPTNILNCIHSRIKQSGSRIRKMGPDYLSYAVLDAIVDNYFETLEHIGEDIESLQNDLMKNPTPKLLHKVYGLKNTLIMLRKNIWPLRDNMHKLMHSENELFDNKTLPFLRDLYDHLLQVIDNIETCRDIVGSMLELYLSSVSFKMNEIMKVLTIIATIFIPLTFIAGIYGMNFEFMPELKWQYGYPAVWGIMSATAIAMLIYFRRKKWL